MRRSEDSRLSDAQVADWSSTRSRGRRRYILRTGVLGYGLPVGIISSLLMQLTGAPGPWWGLLAINFVTFPLAGIYFARAMWSLNERCYQEWSGRTFGSGK